MERHIPGYRDLGHMYALRGMDPKIDLKVLTSVGRDTYGDHSADYLAPVARC